jgi:uncharacterized protein (TIGR00375 family)
MKFVADLHLHSHFSRATSKQLNLEHLSKWARIKGAQVIGTGDIAHPGWLAEMKQKLEPAEEGLFRLKEEFVPPIQSEIFKACQGSVRFLLAGEISNIYKKHGKVRKIHHVVFLPSFAAVEKFQARLEKIGNIRADGRPILGLDSRDLLEIVLETDPQGHLIPAHIWTPWFALLGSMSGFDSVEECFDDLTPQIFALETGLSSDPPMNWRLSALDSYTLVSNSDAHSPQKLAREANLFTTELSYPAIFDALKTGDPSKFWGTLEFFPEEGKYHFDGHRKCAVRWDPKTTIQNNGLCSACGKAVTVGVMHRVETLADREPGAKLPNRPPFKSLIPLPEILAEMYNVGVNSQRVNETFELLLSKLGAELPILMDVPLEELEKIGGGLLAEGIRRMRAGEITIAAGYDGEYGTIRLFNEDERQKFSNQLGFFAEQVTKPPSPKNLKIAEPQESYTRKPPSRDNEPPRVLSEQAAVVNEEKLEILKGLNREQKAAVQYAEGPLVIVAGPGTGKTNTLTRRIAFLILHKKIAAENILAVTFSNKAAQEMAERLQVWVGAELASKITIKTFHALAAAILKEDGDQLGISPQFTILNEADQLAVLKTVFPTSREKELKQTLQLISRAKTQLVSPVDCREKLEYSNVPNFCANYTNYQSELRANQAVDFDDLIFHAVKLFRDFPEVISKYQTRFQWISVDEYQDLNFAQYYLLRQLVGNANNLCVIGDPDQAIYGFRGAQREFFGRFTEDFQQARVISLNKNYRSTQLILDAATQIMSKSSESKLQKLWSEMVSLDKIQIYVAPTDKAEAEYVVHEIEKMMGGTSYFSLDSGRVNADAPTAESSFADFAVLYRLNAQSRLLEEAFARSGIPYQTIGETPFFERKPVKDILAYLWFVYNPHSNLPLEHILTKTKTGLSDSRARSLVKSAKEQRLSIWEMLQQVDEKAAPSLAALTANLKELLNRSKGQSIATLIELIAETGLAENFREVPDQQSELLNRMILRARPFDANLGAFLESAALCSETDEYDARADHVTLMSLHAAKGLEFPVVFIVGCEEGLIPYFRAERDFDLEEERRLFYVGITRAKEKLSLIHAKTRYLFSARVQPAPSRFLSDIENSLKEFRQIQIAKSKAEAYKKSQLSLF